MTASSCSKTCLPANIEIFVYRNGYLRAEYGQRFQEKPGIPHRAGFAAGFKRCRDPNDDGFGRVRFDGISPGEYKLFAFEEIESNAWEDADYIRRFEERAVTIRFAEGGRETVELKLIPAR